MTDSSLQDLMSDGGDDGSEDVPAQSRSGVTPQTRRNIIFALSVIALTGIVAEVIIVLLGNESSEALLTVVATAVGGVAGLAVPGVD